MHFVYIDDSGDGTISCFSALIIPADQWRESLLHMIGVRRMMRDSDGVRIQKELHSTDWNGGKGDLARHPISKERRAQLFDFFLSGVALLPGAQIINAAVPYGEQDRAFEYLLVRIQNNMRKAGSQAVIFAMKAKAMITFVENWVFLTLYLANTTLGLMAFKPRTSRQIEFWKMSSIATPPNLSWCKRQMLVPMPY